MHRHSYKGRKFGREKDQRNALITGLVKQLFENESVTTTLPKAKEINMAASKVLTKAKVGTLHSRRQVIATLNSVPVGNKLVDDIAPRYAKRDGGYFTISKGEARVGDGAVMATISLIEKKSTSKKAKPAKTAAKKLDTPATEKKEK